MAVRFNKFFTLDEHPATSTAGIIHTTISKRLQNRHESLNNTGRRIELAATNTFFFCKLCDAIFISAAQQIFTGFRIRHINVIGENIHYIAQYFFVQIGRCIIFRQHIFQFAIFTFNSPHCIIDHFTNFWRMGSGRNGFPPGFFRNKENIIFRICIRVILKAIPFR